MDKESCKKYYEVLEIDPGSSLLQVRKAYKSLKELYSVDSMVTSPISDEFLDESKQEILDQIEEAYARLLEFHSCDGSEPEEYDQIFNDAEDIFNKYLANISSFNGKVLEKIRKKMGVELFEVAQATNISRRFLEDIENENFSELPPEVYTKGFVYAYAKYLSLDHRKVVDDIMKRYKLWKDMKDGK